jgi:hypothetical protein
MLLRVYIDPVLISNVISPTLSARSANNIGGSTRTSGMFNIRFVGKTELRQDTASLLLYSIILLSHLHPSRRE